MEKKIVITTLADGIHTVDHFQKTGVEDPLMVGFVEHWEVEDGRVVALREKYQERWVEADFPAEVFVTLSPQEGF